jgi:hypothetical protein
MANEKNLIPANKRTKKEQREIARMGGIASGEARRNKKDLRMALEMLLEKELTDKNGNHISGTEAITAKLFEQALKGNVKAFETIRSTVGQDPVQKIMVSEVEQSVIDEVEAMVNGVPGEILKVDAKTDEVVGVYRTAAEAARQNGIDPSNLGKAMKNGKVVGGFKWKKRN